MPEHARPALRRAREYLTAFVQKHQAPRRRIPGARALAAHAGVSYVTMRHAVAELKRQGVLSDQARPRIVGHDGEGGTAQPAGVPGPVPGERRWQQVAAFLEDRIVKGAYGAQGILPSMKEMREEYGTCHRTLRAALQSLASEGVLLLHKKTYRVVPQYNADSTGTVVLVARGTGQQGLLVYAARTWEYLRFLESECSRAGLTLATVPVNFVARGTLNVRGVLGRIERMMRSQTVMGFMVWTQGLRTANVPAFIEKLGEHGRPVAVLDEADTRGIRSIPLVKHVKVAFSEHAGWEVGRYLLGLGHRRAAFITHSPSASFSDARLRGLRRAFQQGGRSERDVTYCPVVLRTRKAEPPPGAASLTPVVQSRPRRVPQAYGLPTATGLYERVGEELHPVFARVLADRSITAWVCVNDDLGLACLEFLREVECSVPEDVSVVGFDDTLDATRRRLTSYNFSNQAVIHSCLSHVLRPERGLRGRGGPVEIEGFITRRESTGKRRAGQ